jgi:hypothetical protein
MRRDPDFFADQDAESALDAAGLDYAIQVENYVGGTIFRTTRAGAFFYVLPRDFARAAESLRKQRLDPQEPALPIEKA